MAPLKEHTILALSNLLSANIDIGLRYSLPMGYHEDTKTRAALMEVLTNILKSGAGLAQFEGLAEEGQVLHDRYEKLVDVSFNNLFNLFIYLFIFLVRITVFPGIITFTSEYFLFIPFGPVCDDYF